MNTHSGIVNTDSGNPVKVFTIDQNGCSPSARISVHDQSESVFMMGRNMQEARRAFGRPTKEGTLVDSSISSAGLIQILVADG